MCRNSCRRSTWSPATSSIGTISGGSPVILGSPSTIVVSLPNAFMLSFVRPLATFASIRFMFAFMSFAPAWRRISAISSSTSIREYQSGRFPIAENVRMLSRYERPTSRLIASRCFSSKPRSRPATAKLATSRLTSHSNGPGKRLVEVVEAEDELPIGRGIAAEVREVRVAAELRVQPRPRPAREIGRHQVRSAAVERERRDEHAAVANGHELGHAGLRLLLEQLDRVGAMGRRLPVAVRRTRHLGARRLAASGALCDGEVLDATADSRSLRGSYLVAATFLVVRCRFLVLSVVCLHHQILVTGAHSSTLPFVSPSIRRTIMSQACRALSSAGRDKRCP